MTVWLHEERSSVTPYDAADQRTMVTADRIAIENARWHSGCRATRTQGVPLGSPHEPTRVGAPSAYFYGYARWTHLTTAFLFAMTSVRLEEIELFEGGGRDVAHPA